MGIARALPVFGLAAVAACSDEVPPLAPAQIVTVVQPAAVTMPLPRLAAVAAPKPIAPAAAEPVAPARGMELYARQCAPCHGDGGCGDGPAATWLDPHPWSFQGGLFKIGSTIDGSPSDADLRRTIERGVPGTSMPAFAHLPAGDLDELVRAVRHLTLVATAAQVESADRDRPRAEVLGIAQGLVAPGRAIELPPRPVGEAEPAVASQAFALKCHECHGSDGTGRDAPEGTQRDAFRFEIWPRDLTRDPLKGGASPEDVARRLVRGMPGTPMPAAGLDAPTLWAVVEHVMRLRAAAPPAPPADATLAAARSAGELPSTPDDAAWRAVPAVRWALRPLRAHADVPGEIDVRALHDGARIAVRIAWRAASSESSGAAIRLARTGESDLALADDPSNRLSTGLWRASVPTASAASSTPSTWPEADRGLSGGGASRDGEIVAVFVGELPAGASQAGAAEIRTVVWSGAAADGRPLEGAADWRRIELAR